MKPRFIPSFFPLVVFISLYGCSIQNSGSITRELADKLTQSITIGGSEVKTGDLPQGHSGDPAYPQITALELPDKIYDGSFVVDVSYGYSGDPSEIGGMLIQVDQSGYYFKVPLELTSAIGTVSINLNFNQDMFDALMRSRNLGSSQDVYGKKFTIVIGMYKKSDGEAGGYVSGTIQPEQGVNPGKAKMSDIFPKNEWIRSGGTVQYSVTVTGVDDISVIWGTSAGNNFIDESGLFTAPDVVEDRYITVTAVSCADMTVSRYEIVKVVAPPKISSFTATPQTLVLGQITKLVGVFTGGIGRLDPDSDFIASGVSIDKSPYETKSYTLVVTNSFNDKAESSLTVVVTQPEPADGGTDAGQDSGPADAGIDGGSDAGQDGGGADYTPQNLVGLSVTFDGGGNVNTWEMISAIAANGEDGGLVVPYMYARNGANNSTVSLSFNHGDGGWDGGWDGGIDRFYMTWTAPTSGTCVERYDQQDPNPCVFNLGKSPLYCLASQCSPMTPTGQTRCYDNSGLLYGDGGCPSILDRDAGFWGQDAMFKKARVFTCDGGPCSTTTAVAGETIMDSVTGLMWQRTFFTGMVWQDAVDQCETLNYGGFQDWYLPNPFELNEIANYDYAHPSADGKIFPGTGNTWYWTSSKAFYYDLSTYAWYANFQAGIIDYGLMNEIVDSRCIRVGAIVDSSGTPEAGGLTGRFLESEPVHNEKVVADSVTGLMWEKNYETSKKWQEALAYCATLDYGGYQDWRLPNINELLSLVNYSRTSPATDFPEMPVYTFWSSTTSVDYNDYAFYLDFNMGGARLGYGKNLGGWVRCVRLGT